MEGIREQLVKRPKTTADTVKKALIMGGSVLIAVILFIILGNVVKSFFAYEIGILALIGLVWGGWYLAGRLNVEYEYTVADGEMQIDKIFNKRSRKMLCGLNLRTAEAFYSSEKHPDGATVIVVCSELDRYTIEYNDPSFGKTALIFTPDERTLEAVKPYLPRAI